MPFQQDVIPQWERIGEFEFSGVYTANPPQKECSHLHIHELDVSEQLQINVLKGYVAQLRDALQNWRIDL